jgi:hypothetical protein
VRKDEKDTSIAAAANELLSIATDKPIAVLRYVTKSDIDI